MKDKTNPETFKNKNMEVVFGAEGGGFPTRLTSKNTFSEATLINQQTAFLKVILDDGRCASPFLPPGFKVLKNEKSNMRRLTFPRIPWRDNKGNLLENFFLSMTYEFCENNTVFVDTFFFVEDVNAPNIKSFKFEVPLDFTAYNQVNWATVMRPKREDFTLIMSDQNTRMMEQGDSKHYPAEIIPMVNFNCKNEQGISDFFEFFMEGHSQLSGNPENVYSAIDWNNGNPVLTWEFQVNATKRSSRPWQWRNHWGWVNSSAPVQRRSSPMRIFHYFDNYKRYPSNRQIKKMAGEGSDVLILHENWRLDAQNGGIPYDYEELFRVRECAHENNMRILLYVRGNENSAVEDYCSWFDTLLERNRDGLYIDYGSAICEDSAPSENFPGGRIHFRKHYMKMRKLRESVGEDGILILHTGPLFSAVGLSGDILDGFITGEGEHGIMIKSRKHHEYFSEAYVAPGTMWTAAFPGYSTEKIIPFLTASGQSAHTPLGVQFDSSSLTHPREPGINSKFLRPLWKLWGIFGLQKNISAFTDYNSTGIFSHNNQDNGAYLMISEDKKNVLVLLTNFSKTKRICETKVNWDKIGYKASTAKCWKFTPTKASPGVPEKYRNKSIFNAEIEASGVVGWLLSTNAEEDKKLNEYILPYPTEDEFDLEYQQHIKQQQYLRETTNPSEELYLKLNILNLAVPYEESLWWDLYNNTLQLGEFTENGKFVPLGWISKNGFITNAPERDNYIWPGDSSPRIALHKILAPGRHSLGIRSLNNQKPFYSFIRATLSAKPDSNNSQAYELIFLSEVEKDREFLKFKIQLNESKLIKVPKHPKIFATCGRF